MKYFNNNLFPIRDDEEDINEEEREKDNPKIDDNNHTFDDVLTDEEFDDLMD